MSTQQPAEAFPNEREPMLHIYAQSMWHGPARIKGNRAALLALRSAIDTALADGTSQCRAFVKDGEGYHVVVSLVTADEIKAAPLPYTDEIANPGMRKL